MHGRGARSAFALVAALAASLIAPAAVAEGEACFNDTDCPGFACGGEVCNWNKFAAVPFEDKIFYCQPAGLAPVPPGPEVFVTCSPRISLPSDSS